jgi:hypothetical protein
MITQLPWSIPRSHTDRISRAARRAVTFGDDVPVLGLASQMPGGSVLVMGPGLVGDRMLILSGARGTRATVAFNLPARRKGQDCLQV